jgi:hypothetical protein
LNLAPFDEKQPPDYTAAAMGKAEIKIEAETIVLRGNFNPAIFQPRWFSAQGLIANSVADSAQIQLIHGQISAFTMDSFEIQVTQDRFMASTNDASSYDPLRDLVLGTFSILKHTPLHQMGLNSSVHLQASTEDKWNQIGHTLAPKAFWEPLLEKPGMLSLSIQALRPDNYKGQINVKVEPSTRIPTGVFVDVNDHFAPESTDPGDAWLVFQEIMDGQWQASRSRATKIVEHIRTQL